jgi:hypothetical protein
LRNAASKKSESKEEIEVYKAADIAEELEDIQNILSVIGKHDVKLKQ